MENYINYLDQTFWHRILGLFVHVVPVFAIMFLTITKSFVAFTPNQGFYLILLYIIIPNLILFGCYWTETSTLLFIIPLWYLIITGVILMISQKLHKTS